MSVTRTHLRMPVSAVGAALGTRNMEALGAALLVGVAGEMVRELGAVSTDGQSVALEAVASRDMEALGLTLLLGVMVEAQKGSELVEEAYKQALIAQA